MPEKTIEEELEELAKLGRSLKGDIQQFIAEVEGKRGALRHVKDMTTAQKSTARAEVKAKGQEAKTTWDLLVAAIQEL